jgi:cytochrome P450
MDEIEDNIITFIGAGHETTARALGWTLYCWPIRHPTARRLRPKSMRSWPAEPDPVKWLDAMPWTRAAFEEAMRLYPPAPSINRAAITDDSWQDENGETVTIEAGTTVLVMPWTLHRHTLLWDRPEAFIPSRFLPENRGIIDRYQYLPFGVGAADLHRRDLCAARGGDRAGCAAVEFRFDCTLPRPGHGRCRNSPRSPKAACRCG